MYVGTAHEVKNDDHNDEEGHNCEVKGCYAGKCAIEHIDKPVHIGEDPEGINDSEGHEEQEEAVKLLDELGVPSQLVNVYNCIAQLSQIKFGLKLVANNDWY